MARSLTGASAPPGLLLLDDPFSAVDLDTEARLIHSLLQAFGRGSPVCRRATIILSSHRLVALPLSDQVLVLDQGRVCEAGAHASLLAVGGLYAHLYRPRPCPL
ncbi:MAG: hypothetical protein PHQ40_20990 [Anaerolineaceae bacterium]|nr:hypothetical protein [Anaerolineaceae bacterium]MDD5371563.1 hypothetical protein [Anaerolineaceae bacterium]